MADVYAPNWHEADDLHTDAAPNGLPENCAPSGVNNWARATMGALKRYVNQQSPVTTTGTSTAFLVSYAVAPGALYDGSTHTVTFHAVNGAAATLNVGATGAKPLHYYSAGAWRVVPAGLWGANRIMKVAYNTAAAAYRILDLPDRTGEVVAFAGATAPAGSLLCYGQAISRTAYAGLFAALSTTHGVGDGTATFNLPDLRGRVAAGKDNMGGSSQNLLTSPLNGDTLGAVGGSEGTGVIANVAASGVGGASVVGQQSVTIVQPTIILNYLIRI